MIPPLPWAGGVTPTGPLASTQRGQGTEGRSREFSSQAFFDECGTGLDVPFFVLAGYIGRVEMWKRFSDDWRAILAGAKDGLPPWPPFHAYLAENGKEGFDVLDETQRKRRIGCLVSVIAAHKPQAVASIVGVEHFKEGLEDAGHIRRRKETWSHPYEFAASNMVGNLIRLKEFTGVDYLPVEPLFDWMERFNVQTARKIEERVIRFIEEDHPQFAGLIGAPRWPSPAERESLIPLQAADLLAWHVGRARNSPLDGPHRRAFRELKRAAPIKYCCGTGIVDVQEEWINGHWQRGS